MTENGRIFVGGISWKADEESLGNFFSSFGKVIECRIIMDKVTKKSKGYGFVTFEDPESAEKVKQSNNLYFLGKMMNVGDAVRKNEGSSSSSRSQGSYNNYESEDQNGFYNEQGQNFYPPQQFYPNQIQYPFALQSNLGQFNGNVYQPAWQPMPGNSTTTPGGNVTVPQQQSVVTQTQQPTTQTQSGQVGVSGAPGGGQQQQQMYQNIIALQQLQQLQQLQHLQQIQYQQQLYMQQNPQLFQQQLNQQFTQNPNGLPVQAQLQPGQLQLSGSDSQQTQSAVVLSQPQLHSTTVSQEK